MSRRGRRLENIAQQKEDPYAGRMDRCEELLNAKRYVEANELCNQILEEQPRYPRALLFSAKLAWKTDQKEYAHDKLKEVLIQQPKNEEALALGGEYWRQKKVYPRARDYFEKLKEVNPENSEAYAGLAHMLFDEKKYEEALGFYKKAAELDPGDSELHLNIGDVYRQLAALDEAEEEYRLSQTLNPENFSATLGTGITYYEKGDYEKALLVLSPLRKFVQKRFDAGRAESASLAKVLWNASLTQLACGRWKAGWEGYYSGFETGTRLPDRKIPRPVWKGESLKGKTIMIWREQGVGDEIAFSFPLQRIVEEAEHCIIECDPRLVPVFKRTYPAATVRGQMVEFLSLKELIAEPDYDVHCPIMQTVPYVYPQLADLPKEAKPFIAVDPAKKAFWKKRLDALGPGPKVGLMWRSGLVNKTRALFYLDLSDLEETLKMPGVQFVNLMYSDCAEEVASAKEKFGVTLHTWEDLDYKDDFESVFALMSGLDAVVSAFTSVQTMAGALAVPTVSFSKTKVWTQFGTPDRLPHAPSIHVVTKSAWNAPNKEMDLKIKQALAELLQKQERTPSCL